MALHLAGLFISGAFGRRLRPRCHQLAIEVGQLLLVDRQLALAGGSHETMLAAEIGDRFLGLFDLDAHALHALCQPIGGGLGGLIAGIQLVDDVGSCNCIGKTCGFDRIFRRHRNGDHISALDAGHLKCATQAPN